MDILVDGFDSNVIYRAGNYIELEEGLRAISQNGAFFKATIGPCSGGLED